VLSLNLFLLKRKLFPPTREVTPHERERDEKMAVEEEEERVLFGYLIIYLNEKKATLRWCDIPLPCREGEEKVFILPRDARLINNLVFRYSEVIDVKVDECGNIIMLLKYSFFAQ
jgi:hypothetical protein